VFELHKKNGILKHVVKVAVPNKKKSIGRRNSGGNCIVKDLYNLYLFKASLGYLNKPVYKYEIWAPGNVYVYVEF